MIRISTPSLRNLNILALFLAIFCVPATFGQSGSVSKDSKPVAKSKEYEAKERRERAAHYKKFFTPAAIKKAQRQPTVKPEMRFWGESEPLSELFKKQRPVSKENGKVNENE
ncbi:MAG: hypothetical protein ABL952_14585, partial [Pyrinomonadaceae bacterium]